ncbi:hypothetical protein F5888DRAFT_1636626 [Russula emetica]|nr:hypothetical protein F5888DRAFT_1636626 [Russula emetica]
MTESFELLCYIEGKTDVTAVSISPSETVYDLKRLIHQCSNLKLSEYSVGGLSLTKYRPKDESNLSAMCIISQVWPNEPPSGQLNVYVSLPSTILVAYEHYFAGSIDVSRDLRAVERIRLKPIGRDRLHIITGKERLREAKVTTNSSHDANEKGLSQIKECLPDKIRDSRKWCHVYITDEKAIADAFRGAKYDVLDAMKISVHTAVLSISGIRINIDDLRRWRTPEDESGVEDETKQRLRSLISIDDSAVGRCATAWQFGSKEQKTEEIREREEKRDRFWKAWLPNALLDAGRGMGDSDSECPKGRSGAIARGRVEKTKWPPHTDCRGCELLYDCRRRERCVIGARPDECQEVKDTNRGHQSLDSRSCASSAPALRQLPSPQSQRRDRCIMRCCTSAQVRVDNPAIDVYGVQVKVH